MVVTPSTIAQVPGGPELLILLFIFVLVFGVPLIALVALAWYLTRRDDGDARTRTDEPAREAAVDDALRNRLEDLERRVEALEDDARDD